MTTIDVSRINEENCDFSFKIENVLDLFKPYKFSHIVPVSERKYYVEDCSGSGDLVPNFQYDYNVKLKKSSIDLIIFDYCNGFFGLYLDGHITTFKHNKGEIDKDENVENYIKVILATEIKRMNKSK